MTDVIPVEIELIKIAQDVRSRSEMWNNEHQIFDEDLCGMCAVAAAELHDKLISAGFEPKIAVSVQECEAHCFILCADYIVDVTATQFFAMKDKRIVVIEQNQHHDLLHYNNITYTFETVDQFKEYQLNAGWPEYQICK